ncbi:hypothetical protein IFM89_035792 [Coptis chinensis]|uniref:THO1-MOS11 C-terminal domain-containing protein n=1 Tax=Coptis chinensis TaxID=261450 RepID=A0A835I7Y2_9MAGN|nr:hypothetical protein IFM89_035792 [Coptis chinensis]
MEHKINLDSTTQITTSPLQKPESDTSPNKPTSDSPLTTPIQVGNEDNDTSIMMKKIFESSSPPSSAADSSTVVPVPVSELEKKKLRAERFGMPMKLSEVEKRNSRAERFGTGSTSHGSDELKKAEELKRKARAERFGLPSKSTDDEEAKKKARSARFAPVTKTDPAEEEKKKARALRFSKTASGALSLNGNGTSEQKTTVVAEASGGA